MSAAATMITIGPDFVMLPASQITLISDSGTVVNDPEPEPPIEEIDGGSAILLRS